MRWIIVLAAALTAAACGGGDGGTEVQPIPDLTGTWQLSYTVSNPTLNVTCQRSGQLTIQQAGTSFSGTYSLSGKCGDEWWSTSSAGNFSGGTVSASAVEFDDLSCRYHADHHGSKDHLSGTADCYDFYYDGDWRHFTGTWEAHK